MRFVTLIFFLITSMCSACHSRVAEPAPHIQPGAAAIPEYLPLLQNKRVALVVNHTSQLKGTHLVDTLLALNIDVKQIFAPEHGFRGEAGAGEIISNSVDSKTGLPIVSLYGKNKKPQPDQLNDIDVVVFDIQDVGARFYTYISTMHYVMEACAELGKQLLILDRPNPNGYYVDGPVLDPEMKSFVGMHPIPIVHGLTVGELAQMINGEGWLNRGIQCEVKIIKAKNYTHADTYSLPVKPSPNLPNDQAINLYPSLCLFEGTVMSVGRGTPFPFQVVGYPDPSFSEDLTTHEPQAGTFSFTPESIAGVAPHPKHEEARCFGLDLRNEDRLSRFTLVYLTTFYQKAQEAGITDFFNSFFDTLAGTKTLRSQIESGIQEEEIRRTWLEDLNQYKAMRKKYLLYEDFE